MFEFMENVRNLHGNIASDVWPNGATLKCKQVTDGKHDVEITASQCGQYLAHGWPACCGQSMLLESDTQTKGE